MKIILFANTDWYLYNFRLNLALALKDRGDDVVLLSPPGDYVTRLESMGFRWVPLPLSRRGMNPLVEIRTILHLARFYKIEKPDAVHHFTIKCVLYGTLAARLVGIPNIINSITGLGYIFLPGRLGKQILRFFVRLWYRICLYGSQVIFENENDKDVFLQLGIIRSTESHVTPGVGIDIERFALQPQPEGVPVVLLAARLLWDKGVGEFVSAARQLNREGIQAHFLLSGRPDLGNPSSIPNAQIKTWSEEGVVEWLGWIDDIRSVLAQVNIVCLPSYREGLPTILIEAAACGRPIIATNVPGCRDALEDGVTGLLVRERDTASLAEAIRKLVLNPKLCKRMGLAGRRLVENKFSSQRVIDQICGIYQASMTSLE